MTTLPLSPKLFESSSQVASAAAEGLLSRPKWLPSWLFYDAAGSHLFEQITHTPEYYVTRTERSILAVHSEEIIALAAGSDALRVVELGAGSGSKTRLLLRAAVDRQDTVIYEPVDVSRSALEMAQQSIEQEISGVLVWPRVANYMEDFSLGPSFYGERRLVLYIGSSIGNFEPSEALQILKNVRSALKPGDSMLLGVDLVKDVATLLTAYDDRAGVTAAFNRNILARLNRELGANFDVEAFAHRALWNERLARMEMHLVSRGTQRVRIPALDLTVGFAAGESIHTENSYKYKPGQAASLLRDAGFSVANEWTDARNWFAEYLAFAE